MEIRKASAFDMPFLLEMLRAYRKETPLEFLSDADDAAYVTTLLTELMAGKGLILVAVNDGWICGMLIAGIGPSIWSPKHLLMKEFAYWVNEESRFTSAGLRLLAEYRAYGEALKAEGRITNFLISKMVNSPDLKYDRYGFQKLEEFWVM
jgi:hypothetical protein